MTVPTYPGTSWVIPLRSLQLSRVPSASVPLNAWGDWLGKWLYGGSADAINQLLINAMLDPVEAARLMGKRQYVPKRSIGEIFGNSGRAAGNVALRNLANTYGGLLGEFARSDRERR